MAGLASSPLPQMSADSLAELSSSALAMIGSGLRWAIVRIGPFTPNFLYGKATGGISSGEGGSVNVYVGSGAGQDSGVQETAFSPFGTVSAGDFVGCCWNGFGWYVIAEKCGS